ncbi:MAG: caspase family protein, partial [Bacteroidota bacterium]
NSFTELTNLKKLLIHHAELTEMPAPLLLMENLTHLDLGNNQLTELPESLTYLSGIKRLYLNDNQLAELPEIIGRFERLEILQLQNNQLTRLPDSLRNLQNLKFNAQSSDWQKGLRLEGNPLFESLDKRWQVAPPKELLGRVLDLFTEAEESAEGEAPSPPESEAFEEEAYYSDFHELMWEGGRNMYALLIGIDDYGRDRDIRQLQGCENDVLAMQAFLRRQLQDNGHSYRIMSLLNEKATQENVGRAIEELLAEAPPESEVLFYFAGYGDVDESGLLQKMPTADPSRKLVLYAEEYSFISGWSEQNLRELKERFARQEVNFHYVIDAGYAMPLATLDEGLQFRNWRFLDLPQPRDAELAPDFFESERQNRSTSLELYAAGPRASCPEMLLGEESRGLFTFCLLECLREEKQHGRDNIYAKLINKMRGYREASEPEVKWDNWEDLPNEQLFGGLLSHSGANYELRFVAEQNAWRVSAGYRDGLRSPHPVTKEMTVLDVFDPDVPPQVMAAGEGQIGQLRVELVRARSSWISPGEIEMLDQEKRYVARVNRLPIERLRYSIAQQKRRFSSTKIRGDIELPGSRESDLYLQLESEANRANYFLSKSNSVRSNSVLTLFHRRDRERPI